jgi:hypothetical protein
MPGTTQDAITNEPIEIPLKLKHRRRKQSARRGGGNYNGNSGVSNGKHIAHPTIHGFRRNGYRCEPKWNRHDTA